MKPDVLAGLICEGLDDHDRQRHAVQMRVTNDSRALAILATPAMQAVLTVLREAERLHYPGKSGNACVTCMAPWPCDTRQALDTIGGGQ